MSMRKIIRFIPVIVFFVGMGSVYAQPMELTSKNKKACKSYMKATEYYQIKDYVYALIELDRATNIDPYFIEAWMLKGDIKDDQKLPEDAIGCYQKAIEINPDFFPRNFYNLARIQLALGKYEESWNNYKTYLSYPDPNPHLIDKIRFDMLCCEFGVEAIANPIPFDPQNMGDSINTQYNEYSPTLTVDEQTFIITRQRPRDDQTIHTLDYEEDFFQSNRNGEVWARAKKMAPPMNSHGNEGAQCISPDGQFMYLTICNRDDGYGSCDLYYAKRVGNKWSTPENMGALVNSSSWDSQPTISPDGKTIYFASARKGGLGNMDIWKTSFENGIWKTPVNLGDSVNSKKGEMSPFIHPDGQTLYFTSNGHIGMGGNDIYLTRMDTAGVFHKPFNLGYPINTHKDEGFLIVNAKGDKAYFASDQFGGKGGLDLYTFALYEKARPVTVTYMKGVVYDKNTLNKLEARFELIDLETGTVVVQSNSDPLSGEFLVSLPNDKNYALNVSREGYLSFSENFTLKGTHDQTDPFLKDVPLQPVEAGATVILKNIFFDFDKFELLPESRIELDRWVEHLKNNPRLKIEVGGHTDNKGSKEYNQVLSENRARSVYTYLMEHGIDKVRLTYKGYGLSQPIDTNDTDEGRANNRRTEFKVMAF
jgi:outer membrane protein OmpA-like peptidoglycan-associated protein/Tol biopolymer transport system component